MSAASGESKHTHDLIVKYTSVLIDNSPKEIQPYIKKAVPYLIVILEFVEKATPIVLMYYEKLVQFWISLQPYKPHLLLPSFIGLILCFFGGSFLTLIAAVEAFNMCGSDITIKYILELYNEFNKAVEANKKDDKVDKDGDGVADVLQISNTELIARKATLFLRVIDPVRLEDTLTGISAGAMAVLAALQLEFARTIALGNAIANTLEKPVHKFVIPFVESQLDAEYKKWAKPVVHYLIKSFAISIAWAVQRVISAFHSAIRGGLMFSRNIITYLREMNFITINDNDTYLDEVIGYGIAALGFLVQLFFGFALPFPLNILLLPFTIAEYVLISFVAN